MANMQAQAKKTGANTEIPFASRPAFFGRIRVQLILIFLFQALAIILGSWFYPAQSLLDPANWSNTNVFVRSLLPCGIASIVSYLALRSLTEYAGTKSILHFAPSLMFAYGLMALIALGLRIDYNRPAVLLSMLGTIIWLLGDYLLRVRKIVPHLTLVPGGDLRDIQKNAGVIWHMLREPSDHTPNTDAIVTDLHHDHDEHWERYLARCMLAGLPVYDVKSMAERLTGKVEIEHLSENDFGTVLPSSLYLKIKYLLDVGLAVLVLPLFLIIIGVFALSIRLESKGKAIFTQSRVGFRGKTFTIYKIRSMSNTAAQDGTAFTAEGDARITRLGHFIRKYRIDEFPQIFNILKGEMSWIGPRPEAVELSKWYEQDIPFYVYRHMVRPGITGWAQVNQGNVAQIEAATEKLQYDFYYIRNFSPWLDLLIVFQTLYTMATGFGSR
jgi:lipopolysaccharide/colanic/teichoic acid biosynthesis glycosyltransferase